MRSNKESRFTRYWQERDLWTIRSNLLLPVLIPVILVKVLLLGTVATVIWNWLQAMPSALEHVSRAVRVAETSVPNVHRSTQLKGGEFWQTGFEVKGSLIRPGGSLSSDDLRRRLNELRSTKSGGPVRRSLNGESQYGK